MSSPEKEYSSQYKGSEFGFYKKQSRGAEEEQELTEEEKKLRERKRQLRVFKEQLEDLIKLFMEGTEEKEKKPKNEKKPEEVPKQQTKTKLFQTAVRTIIKENKQVVKVNDQVGIKQDFYKFIKTASSHGIVSDYSNHNKLFYDYFMEAAYKENCQPLPPFCFFRDSSFSMHAYPLNLD